MKQALVIAMAAAIVISQPAAGADVPPSTEDAALETLAAQVVWGKSSDHGLTAHFDARSQLYWARPRGADPKRLLNSFYKTSLYQPPDKARIFLASLVIDGQSGWDLPAFADAVKAPDEFSGKLQGDMLLAKDKMVPDYHTKVLKPCANGAYGLDWSVVKSRCADPFGTTDSRYFVPVRPRSQYDNIIEASNKSSEQKLTELTKLLMAQALMVATPTALARPAPKALLPTRLDKGEFETSDMFQKRVSAEDGRVRAANQAQQDLHAAALTRFEAAQVEKQREQAEARKRNQQPDVMRATFVAALAKAMTLLYGDPVLTDFQYNADKQTFSGRLTSEKEGFDRIVEFPVPLNKAAQVKAQLTDARLIPQIVFDAKGTNLSFAKLNIIDNAMKQQQEFAMAKKADTLAAYENFLRLNPSAPQAALAEKGIAVLRASAAREKEASVERERQKQLRDAQNEQRAQAEARQLAMLGPCTVGGVVYHRERWDTTTGSGNMIADVLFGAATKEQFLIVFEGVVEATVGDKVKVMINDYRVQQTRGGGFLSRKTYQGDALGLYADKYIGKTQYYPRSRCGK